MKKVENIKLFVNNTEKSLKLAQIVDEKLKSNGFNIVSENYDLALAIGGDGTFLRMVKENSFNSNILYVGINSGTLGFAQEFEINEIDLFIEKLKKSEYIYEEIGIQEITIETQKELETFYSLNEVVVRDEELKTVELNAYIDNGLLEEYVGDGLLISTSFGSTAYNLSFGGSIVYNTFHTLQITPVAPLNNKSYRSLINSVIIPANKEIKLIPKKKNTNLLLTIDGSNYSYSNVLSVSTTINDKVIKIIRKNDYNFIKKVNEKFLK